MRLIRCSGIFILLLASLLFVLSAICLMNIDIDDFRRKKYYLKTEAYADEMYWYSLQIERMKVIHASLLLIMGVFLA